VAPELGFEEIEFPACLLAEFLIYEATLAHQFQFTVEIAKLKVGD
jgi:hypothetical protein